MSYTEEQPNGPKHTGDLRVADTIRGILSPLKLDLRERWVHPMDMRSEVMCGKCPKPAFFSMPSRGRLLWLRKEVKFYQSLWEHDY